VLVDLFEEGGVGFHCCGEVGVLLEQPLDVIGVAFSVQGYLGGDGSAASSVDAG
jgi:hypothetical protein